MIDKILKKLNIRGKLIYLSQYGSHLYGLDTPSSDFDFRGIYIPTLEDIILKRDLDEINEEIELDGQKVDVKIFSLSKFIKLCSKADTNALDLLFAVNTTADHVWQYLGFVENVPDEMKYPIWYIYKNRDKLINTDRLESPITYAFKQATKYGLKGERLKVLQDVLERAMYINVEPFILQIKDLIPNLKDLFDNKHLKVEQLDNKGKLETYLYVCGIYHQVNLDLDVFIERIEEKINKEYTSQRTIDAKDGNDWKALSHAIRVLLEVKELLQTQNIKFPLKEKDFVKDIKLGKVNREDVDKFFSKELENILDLVQQNVLQWKYDEQFWNEFILKEVKNG